MAKRFREMPLGYLAPGPNAFWRWEERAQVASWVGGGTIAFASEIKAIVTALADTGLPPIEAILLLVAACRPAWKDLDRGMLMGAARYHESKAIVRVLKEVQASGAESSNQLLDRMRQAQHPLQVFMQAVLEGLDRIHELPQEYRSKLDSKVSLAKIVFESVPPAVPPAQAKAVAGLLKAGFDPDLLMENGTADERPDGAAATRFADGLAALFQGLAVMPLTRDRVGLRLRTGLDELPQPAPVETPPAQNVRELLEQLAQDSELSGLSRLAHDLMAVVCLPRRVSDHEELPVGGFSDIANRGSLDRLLPGELAHDDLTLAVRVALNEAMYFRRETPPRNPTARRRLLIDTGIRLWGVPRVFAAAVALAMAATTESHTKVVAWRTKEHAAVETDLLTRQGLVELLETLSVSPHPGSALAALLAQAGPQGEALDDVLITSEDVLADPEFQLQLHALTDRTLYVASVNADGEYQLQSWSPAGHRILRRAQLKLDDILTPQAGSQKRQPLIDENRDTNLPLLFSVRPMPLLLSTPGEVQLWAPADKGIVAVTTNSQLLRWQRRDRGALQLSDSLPNHNVRWLGVHGESAYTILASNEGLLLIQADLEGMGVKETRLSGIARLEGACVIGDHLCLINPGIIEVLSLPGGKSIQTLRIATGMRWQQGRVFRSLGKWAVLSQQPSGFALQELPIPAPLAVDTLAVFERHSQEGLWVVLPTGQILKLEADKEFAPKPGPRLYTRPLISPDGELVYLTREDKREYLHWVGGTSCSTTLEPGSPPKKIGYEYLRAPSGGLRRSLDKILAVGIEEGTGNLCLKLKNGLLGVRVGPAPLGLALTLSSGSMREPRKFSPQRTRYGFQVRVAGFKDGSRVWIDSRGLLHLRSSNPKLPELSLVMVSQGNTGAWASDGSWCGLEYFIGDHAAVSPHAICTFMEQFANTAAVS
ncbi:MAG: hypothetical protein ABFD92_02390 [Planctomycetaceae bacterium]|nr:hypothetical protein [Planctomycetaceae bacterium]